MWVRLLPFYFMSPKGSQKIFLGSSLRKYNRVLPLVIHVGVLPMQLKPHLKLSAILSCMVVKYFKLIRSPVPNRVRRGGFPIWHSLPGVLHLLHLNSYIPMLDSYTFHSERLEPIRIPFMFCWVTPDIIPE